MQSNWSVFDGFTRPSFEQNWSTVDDWVNGLRELLEDRRKIVNEKRQWWSEALRDLGGDPSERDWTSFRLLRRDREEDWSDWLAELIQQSQTGRFAWALFGELDGRPQKDFAGATVDREVSHDGYRADLVIHWTDGTYTHLEVKVGDPNLTKTLETAEKMRLLFETRSVRLDAVLLLPSQSEAWVAACRCTPGMRERVWSLTWIDIARALRKALLYLPGETIHWRVWAHAYCGAIEQELLELTPQKWISLVNPAQLDLAETLFSREGAI